MTKVTTDYETALALADAPRSLRYYIAALQAENDSLWSTYVALVDKLGIDTEKAKTADGKPSDVIVSYVDKLRAENDRLRNTTGSQESYPHNHPLHKAVFMARESYTGGETFEEGVHGLIAELKEARQGQGEVQMLLEALEGMLLHIREPESESEFQWSGHFKKQKAAFVAARAAIAAARQEGMKV